MNEIDKILDRYGELVFQFAVNHLLNIGRTKLQDMKMLERYIESIQKEPKGETDPVQVVSPELRVESLRCAAELAKFEINDILAYLQFRMGISGITVHPGRIVKFRTKKDPDCECIFFLERKLNDSEQDRLKDLIRNRIFNEKMSFEDAIYDTLKAMDIRKRVFEPDEEITI